MAYSTTILAESSLVSYWQLAETSGTSAADSKGTNTGTYTGGYTLGQMPPATSMSGAVLFNGTSGYVLVKSGLIIGNLANASIEAWIKSTSSAGQAIYCERPASGNDIWKLVLSSSSDPGGIAGRAEFVHRDDAGTLNWFAASTTINNGAWHHVVLTKAGTALVLYVDGVQVNSGTMSGTDTMTNAGIQSRIGADQADATVYFSGTISNVAVYNAALSASAVLAHYNAATSNPRARISQTGLLAVAQGTPAARVSQTGTLAVATILATLPAIPGSFRVKRGSSPTTTLADGQLGWNRSTKTLNIGDTGSNYPAIPVNPSLCQGRLSLSSTLAVPTTDITSAATVYLQPYNGTGIAIYSGSAWTQYTIVGAPTLSLAAAVAGVYDVYLDWNSGSPVLNFLAWTSNTARGTALIQQDGVYCVGINTRRYLGTIYLHATGLTQDTLQFRQVWNYCNRVVRLLARSDPTSSWTYSTNAWRAANGNPSTANSTGNCVTIVTGVAEEAFHLSAISLSLSTVFNGAPLAGIGEDSITAPLSVAGHIGGQNNYPNSNAGIEGTIALHRLPTIGWHSYYWLENAATSGTATWYGQSNTLNMGLSGWIRG